jgi:hypothetical protein
LPVARFAVRINSPLYIISQARVGGRAFCWRFIFKTEIV